MWELGYWVDTLRRWYKEGLPENVGIPKNEVTPDGRVIFQFEDELPGGRIPTFDASVSPDIPWENFVYYRTRLNEMIVAAADA